jgi:hypothetical protein
MRRRWRVFENLLRPTFCASAVLEILIYIQVNSGFCAPALHKLSSLATVFRQVWKRVGA